MGCGSSRGKELDVDVFLDTEAARGEAPEIGAVDDASGGDQATEPTGLRAGVQGVDGREGETGDQVDFPDKPALIVPSHIYFSAREEESTEMLNLESEEEVPVFFKVKTTHPHLLFVRPVRGKLAPHAHLSVRVNYIPPDDYLTLEKQLAKVKLMVQALKVDFPRDELPQAVWTGAPKESLYVKVIKAKFSEKESELDLTKFVSVQAAASGSDLWWK